MYKNSGDVGMLSAVPAENPELVDTSFQQEFRSLAAMDITPAMKINSDPIEEILVDCIYLNPQCSDSQSKNRDRDRMNPFTLADECANTWPNIEVSVENLTDIYNKVKLTGLPNTLGAKILLSSSIKIHAWEKLAQAHGLDDWLLNMLSYGFPLQYTGTIPGPNRIDNHSSALQYPEHVRKFIAKELREGALAGPFDNHPFPSSGYINPLMSRPKAGSADRRIIVDLAYPDGNGVNAHVQKNTVFGKLYDHQLPSTNDAVHMAKILDLDVVVAVIDIERAYRNYRSDPIDWPLLVIAFDNRYYIDLGLPFGARLSSLYVQRIADFITRVLASEGILCAMYLDDLFIICHKQSNAQQQLTQAMTLLRSLGLPINYKKLITPTTQAVWLGVHFNFDNSTISVPQNKVQELLDAITHIQSCQFISYKQTQSIIGRIAHVARVVPATRIFMARILDQLRASNGSKVYINHAILSDLKWFKTYFSAHNATSLIDNSPPTLAIEADSSLIAGGAWADGRYYIYAYPPGVANAHNICQLEALNYLVAARVFINNHHKGRSVEIIGDNAGAISALSTGRANDSVLAAISRALWFHCATRDIKLIFTHRPGTELYGADALSRAPLGLAERARADRFIGDAGLSPARLHGAYINYSKYL